MILSNRGTISNINNGISAAGSFAQSAATSGLSPTAVIAIVVIAVLAGLLAAFWAISKGEQKDIDEDPDVEKARRNMKTAGHNGDWDLDSDEEATGSLRRRNEDEDEERLQEKERQDGSREGKNAFPTPRYPNGPVLLTSAKRSHIRTASWDSRADEGAVGDRDRGRQEERSSLLRLSPGNRVKEDEERQKQGQTGDRIDRGQLRAPKPTVPPRSPRLVTCTDSDAGGRTA